jgi:oxygen-dependent protoporphyrinogen oxidase
VASLFLGYRREDVAHPLDGFGVLAPEIERRSVLGILFSSSLFAGRAPEGHVALTVMVGGVRQPDIARLPADQLLAAVDRDLKELLGVKGTPVFQRHTVWPRAIPQYNLGYERFLDTMAATERAMPGLFIGGQARDGIALPACLAAGEKLAGRVASTAS